MDHLQEFEQQHAFTENIFSKIFGKKEEPRSNDFFVQNNLYYFGGGKSVAKKINEPPKEFLEQFDWHSSKLNFVVSPATSFEANVINFDLKSEEIKYFDGIWKSGPFIGRSFKGVYQGNDHSFFQGSFMGKYDDFQAPPFTFVEGTFFDMTNKGILGLPNALSVDKSVPFEFITIPVNYALQFRTQNGITGIIKMIKRLDQNSSTFICEVTDGFKGDKYPRQITIQWQNIRQNWGKGIYKISENSTSIAGLIEIPTGDKIVEMYVSAAQSSFNTAAQAQPSAAQFTPGQLYKFDLSRIPGFNIKKLRGSKGQFLGNPSTEVYFSFASPAELNNFFNLSNYITTGSFAQDLKDVERAIRFGEVDGYGPFNYLSGIFNGVEGKKTFQLVSEIKKKVQFGSKSKNHKLQKPNKSSSSQTSRTLNPIESSMKRLSDFVKYFIDNVVTKAGKPYDGVKQLLTDKMREILGTSKVAPAATQSQTTAKPGKNQANSTGNASQFIQGMGMTEAIREAVRNIIDKTF